MRYVTVLNQTTGQELARRAAVADSMWTRFLGLQGQPRLPRGAGLVLLPCASIHMLFMRFPIDAIFATREGQVVRIGRGLRPWISACFAPGALYCVELPAGAAAATETGHIIALRQIAEGATVARTNPPPSG
jgi:uncharacterized membrane protein (UPF0127 family)